MIRRRVFPFMNRRYEINFHTVEYYNDPPDEYKLPRVLQHDNVFQEALSDCPAAPYPGVSYYAIKYKYVLVYDNQGHPIYEMYVEVDDA